MKKSIIYAVATACVIIAGPLSAHPVDNESATFTNGLLHPLSDWGYVTAMLAIGLWVGWRRARLPEADLVSWIAIATLFSVNGYLHASVLEQMTWWYATGMLLNSAGLLVLGILAIAGSMPSQVRSLLVPNRQ